MQCEEIYNGRSFPGMHGIRCIAEKGHDMNDGKLGNSENNRHRNCPNWPNGCGRNDEGINGDHRTRHIGWFTPEQKKIRR